MTIDEVIAQAREKADKNSGCWKYCASNKNCDECEQENKQLAEWMEELKALRILLDWAIECGFGLDSFPDEYEQYKHTLTDDMSYTEMVKKIAKCVVEEQLEEGGENEQSI